MFDYHTKTDDELAFQASSLPLKLRRWVAIHHPDNRLRVLIFKLSGISIGTGTVINSGFVVSDDYEDLLHIGERVAISPNVCVICSSSPNNSKLQELPEFTANFCRKEPVTIGDDCWIGAGAIILPGANIGSNAVIGAGAVVSRPVEDYVVVAGVPARQLGDVCR